MRPLAFVLFLVAALVFGAISAYAAPSAGSGSSSGPSTWTITFDSNGGAVADGVDALSPIKDIVEGQDAVVLPDSPYVRDGYTFAGWHTKAKPSDPNKKQPNPKDPETDGRYVPDKASLFDLSYNYVVLDDGEIKVVGDDVAARGEDSEGREVRACDLRDQLSKRGTLILYAQWEKAESSPAVDETDTDKSAADDEEATDGAVAGAADEAADTDEQGEGAKDAGPSEPVEYLPPRMELTDEEQAAVDAAEEAAANAAAEAAANATANGGLFGIFAAPRASNPDSAAPGSEEDEDSLDTLDVDTPLAPDGSPLVTTVPEPTYPSTEGNTAIESIRVKWLIGNDEDHLSLSPTTDAQMTVRMQLDYSVSGDNKNPYAPGTIEILVPAKLFTDRNGNPYGAMSLSVPEEPETGAVYNYTIVTGEDGETYYRFTNTRRLEPTHRGLFEFSVVRLTPHMLVDMATQGNFWGLISVKTVSGHTIQLASNEIDAQVNTYEVITDSRKRGVLKETWPDEWPRWLKPVNADDYIYVRWYTYAYHRGNQPFSLSIDDVGGETGTTTAKAGLINSGDYDDSLYGEIVLGSDAAGLYHRDIYGPDYEPDTGSAYDHLEYIYTAYPKDAFEAGKDYELHNTVDWTLTPADGKDDPTHKQATASVIYSPRGFVYPTGHFMVYKWAGHSTGAKDKDYAYGLNLIARGEDVDMDFTLQTIGYGYPWTYYDPENPGMGTGDDWEYAGDGTVPVKPECYGQVPYTMVTYDEHTFFDFLEPRAKGSVTAEGFDYDEHPEYDLTSDDFKVVSLEFRAPTTYNYELNTSTDEWEYLYNDDITACPDIEAYAMLDGTGDWIHYGTVSYASGRQVITAHNGATANGPYLVFPENVKVTDFKTEVTATNAAVIYNVYPTIRLFSNEKTRAIAEKYFEESDNPSTKFRNDDRLEIFDNHNRIVDDGEGNITLNDDEGTPIGEIFDYARSTLSGISLGVSSTKSLQYDRLVDSDRAKQIIILHYTAEAIEQSNLTEIGNYNDAISKGLLHEETSGIWYDLLPAQVVPDVSTVKLRDGDTIKKVRTIDNYKESGRTLLIVEADLAPNPQPHFVGGRNVGYRDTITLTFDASYTWESLTDFSKVLRNEAAFESTAYPEDSDEVLGTIKGQQGEPDNPRGGNNNQSAGAIPRADVDLMTNLDPNSDKARFVYASTQNEVSADLAAFASYSKLVSVDGSGFYSNGQNNQATTWEGGTYTYRLRATAEEGKSMKDLIFFDTLESYVPLPASEDNPVGDDDYGDPQWQGTLTSVDVSQMAARGVDVKVYYSTMEIDSYHDEAVRDLSNDDIWTLREDYEASHNGDVSGVRSIAIDASHKADGSEFELRSGESLTSFIHMLAPVGDYAHAQYGIGREAEAMKAELGEDIYMENPRSNAHAYNDTTLVCKVTADDEQASSSNIIHNTYTKVGLVPYQLKIKKVWQDAYNKDGIRPGSVTINLLANGEPALDAEGNPVEPLVLSAQNGWSGAFTGILPVDVETGQQIDYSFSEDAVEGYKASFALLPSSGSGSSSGSGAQAGAINDFVPDSYQVTNVHKPEKVSINGTKTWDDSNNAAGARPESITVKLFADGKFVKSQTVTPSPSGTWSYSFEDLDKNKREGGVTTPIAYTVEEEYVPGYATEYETDDSGSTNIINTYSPVGNIVVEKYLVDATPTAADTEFSFTLLLWTGNEDSEDPDNAPLLDEYPYTIVDPEGNEVDSGTIGNAGTFVLKGGQRMVVSGVPSESFYKVTENETDGFTNTLTEGSEGAVLAGRTQLAAFENTYRANGSVQLGVTKQLTGRELERYGFIFHLYAEDGSLMRNASNQAPESTEENEDGVTVSSASVSFGQLRYTLDDLRNEDGTLADSKTFSYYIEEENSHAPGYGYDDSRKDVTVTVTDNGDGTLSAVADFGDTPAVFDNTYAADGEVVFRVWKDLKGGELRDGQFSFELRDPTGKRLQVARNDGNGLVSFAPVKFDQNDVGKEFIFTVTEQFGGEYPIGYDLSTKAFVVNVFDNGDGTLSFSQKNATVSDDWFSITCPECGGVGHKGEIDESCSGVGTETYDIQMTYYPPEDAGIPAPFSPENPYSLDDADVICQTCKGTGVQKRADGSTIGYCPDCYGSGSSLFASWYNADPSDFWLFPNGPSASVPGINHPSYGNSKPILLRKSTNYGYLVMPNFDCDGCGGLGFVPCEKCGGSGTLRNPDATFTQTEELPVFVNSYPPGYLTVSKYVQNGDPDNPNQDFTFRLVLAGEGIEESNIYINGDGTIIDPPVKPSADEDSDEPGDNNQNPGSAEPGPTSNGATLLGTSDEGDGEWVDGERVPNVMPGKKSANAAAGEESEGFAEQLAEEDAAAKQANKKAMENADDVVSMLAEEAEEAAVDASTQADDELTVAEVAGGTEGDGDDLEPLATVVRSGIIGTCNWTLDDEGTLIIEPINGVSGAFGDIVNNGSSSYPNPNTPWNSFRTQLKKVEFKGSIRGVGSLQYLFYRCENLEEVIGLANLDTSEATDMQYMFYMNRKLAVLDGFETLNTANTTSMKSMFYGCGSLPDQDFSNFNTSKVTDMSYMFSGCNSMKHFNLGSFDTGNVTNMAWMFWGNENVESIDVSSFNTSKVTDMSYMFSANSPGKQKLTSLDVSGFDTRNVTNMQWMFWACGGLTELDVSGFDMRKVQNAYGMFNGCKSLTSLDVSNFEMPAATNISSMFGGCTGLTELDVSKMDWRNVVNAQSVFNGCSSITYLDLSAISLPKATNIGGMFGHCTSLVDLDISNLNTVSATYAAAMFAGDTSLVSPDLSGLKTGKVTNFAQMFESCSGLKSLDLSTWDVSKAEQMYLMFSGCTSLESLNLDGWDTHSVVNNPGHGSGMGSMFMSCSQLKEITVGEDFSFIGGPAATYYAYLPTPPYSSPYTGYWIKSDYSTPHYSAYSLVTQYEDLPYRAGTWVWEDTSKIVTIEFDSNGGSGYMESMRFPPEVERALPKSTMQRFNHTFKGWNTKPDGSGTSYDDEQVISNIGEAGQTVTLYAQWEKKPSQTPGEVEIYFTLKGGQHEYFNDVPAGTSYQVYELTPDGWILVDQSGTSGTIRTWTTLYADFTNSYQPDTAQALISATKKLDGEYADEGAYTFRLLDSDGGLVQEKSNAAGGLVQFDPINYEGDAAAGVYDYTIVEVPGNDATIDYDSHEENVKVKVERNDDGKLIASVSYDRDGAAFANRTKPATLSIQKEAEGLTDQNNAEFEFTVKLTQPDGRPLSTRNVSYRIDDHDGLQTTSYDASTSSCTVTMKGGQTLHLVDLPAGTLYEVIEGDIPSGWAFKSSDENASGTLSAGEEKETVFTNEYSAVGYFTPRANKVIEGGTVEAGQFTFELRDAEGAMIQRTSNAPVDTQEKVLDEQGHEVTNPDYNKAPVLFDMIEYTEPGVYEYVIVEIPGNDASMIYDEHEEHITVTVTDNGDGSLKVEPVYDSDDDTDDYAGFINALVPGTLSLAKNVLGGTDATADVGFGFTLELLDASGNPLSRQEFVLNGVDGAGSVKTNADGKATITIKDGQVAVIEGLPAGTAYRVVEAEALGFKNTAKSGESGTISADSGSRASFENTYSASGSIVLAASKTLTGQDLTAGRFTFELLDANGKLLQTAVNDAEGNVIFRALNFTATDVGQKTYRIVERNGEEAGIKYDDHAELVTVTIDDNADGTLDVAAVYDNDGAAFENSYDATGELEIEASKTLEGADLGEGQFTFEVRDAEGNVVKTAENDAQGVVHFEPIGFSLADVGTHTFVVAEVVPAGAEELGDGKALANNIIYDTHVEEFTVTVTDNGDGTLAIDKSGMPKNIVFANSLSKDEPPTPTPEPPAHETPYTGDNGGALLGIGLLMFAAAAACLALSAGNRRRQDRLS